MPLPKTVNSVTLAARSPVSGKCRFSGLRHQMEEFEWDNTERPIETYPGFIGMTMDREFYPQDELRRLERLN